MNDDISTMVNIYGAYEIDWMGDEIKNLSDLTRHHIVKKEHGGQDDIGNYALLTKGSHILLHYLEDNYYSEYVRLNNLFLYLNKSYKPPVGEYYEEVRSILKRVKKDIKNKKRGRK